MDADTDAAMVSVAAGNAPAQIKTQSILEIGGLSSPKTSQTNLLKITPVTVDLAEPMSFSYLVVNNGHADESKILAALAVAGNSLSLAGCSSMQEDIALEPTAPSVALWAGGREGGGSRRALDRSE